MCNRVPISHSVPSPPLLQVIIKALTSEVVLNASIAAEDQSTKGSFCGWISIFIKISCVWPFGFIVSIFYYELRCGI